MDVDEERRRRIVEGEGAREATRAQARREEAWKFARSCLTIPLLLAGALLALFGAAWLGQMAARSAGW